MRFPGVRWYWHGIDRGKFIQVWEQISDPEAREVITADNITVKVNPVIYFTIDNPLAFVAGAENPIKMMTELAQTLVLASCGQEGKTFEEIRGKVQEIGDDIKKSLNKESEKTEDENNADDQIEKKKIDEEIKPLKEEINKIKGEETTLSDNERFSFGKIKKKIGFKMSRNKIKRKLRLSESKRLLEECRRRWGIKVSRVQIQGLLPPEEVIRAMESVYKAKKMAQTEVENAKGQAAARKKIADVKKYEMKREAEGASALIAKQGQALSGSGGDRYFGIEVSKTIKSGDKVIVANLGDNKEGGIIGAMVGALVGGLKGKGDKKE